MPLRFRNSVRSRFARNRPRARTISRKDRGIVLIKQDQSEEQDQEYSVRFHLPIYTLREAGLAIA